VINRRPKCSAFSFPQNITLGNSASWKERFLGIDRFNHNSALEFSFYTCAFLSLPLRRVSGAEKFGRLPESMDRAEKLRMSADTTYCCCFRQGMFVKFYEQGLYWFHFVIKPLKPMREKVKNGESIIYGGLPIESFEKILGEKTLLQAEVTEYG
jgi:hypothetical protein